MNAPIQAGDAHEARLADLREATRRAQEAVGKSHATIQRISRSLGSGPAISTDTAFRTFGEILQAQGVRAALAYIVGLTDYRFISIFRFRDGKATSSVHVDRSDASATQADEVPDSATYCCYVRDSRGSFVTVDAAADPRTADHAARSAVPSYCGVPIFTPEGELIGTLCHYDVVARDPQRLDLELLIRVSSALARPGVVPPYPERP